MELGSFGLTLKQFSRANSTTLEIPNICTFSSCIYSWITNINVHFWARTLTHCIPSSHWAGFLSLPWGSVPASASPALVALRATAFDTCIVFSRLLFGERLVKKTDELTPFISSPGSRWHWSHMTEQKKSTEQKFEGLVVGQKLTFQPKNNVFFLFFHSRPTFLKCKQCF